MFPRLKLNITDILMFAKSFRYSDTSIKLIGFYIDGKLSLKGIYRIPDLVKVTLKKLKISKFYNICNKCCFLNDSKASCFLKETEVLIFLIE